MRDPDAAIPKTATRGEPRRSPLEALGPEVRYALRRLARDRAFAATAILILAVGIGACTAMFSIVRAVLLRPLGVNDPGRVVVLWAGHRLQQNVIELSYNAQRELRARMRSFDDVAILGSVNWSSAFRLGTGEPTAMPFSAVSATFFDVLGARPLLGRTFRAEDDQPASARVLVLGHATWMQHFGGDPGVIGRRVMVAEGVGFESFEIIGVMPAEFFYPRGAKYWTPAVPLLASSARANGEPLTQVLERLGVFYGVARLNPRAITGSVRADAALYFKSVGDELKIDLTGTHFVFTPILDHIFGSARLALLALMGAVVIVLFIACFNVAGLLFARGASRSREMAVRAALGASRGVLVRQLLVESALFALSAAVVGVAAAAVALDTLVALSPADIPRLDATALDARALVFAIAIAAATTLVVGLAPAAQLSRPSLVDDFKGAETGMTVRGGRARRALIATQIAATLVLLISAGLCVRSFERLSRLDLGFDPAGVLTFAVSGLDPTRYPAQSQRHDAVEQILSRIGRAPHVSAAGAVLQRPFENGPIGWDAAILLEGQTDTPQPSGRNPMVNWETVTTDYFRSMSIRLVRGRSFDATDTETSPLVAIVSEAAAARVWPGENPIGKRLRQSFSEDTDKPRWLTVVGVVATARYREMENPRLDLYAPLRQTTFDVQHFTVRTTIDPLAAAPTIAAEIASFDKGLAMIGVTTMESIVERTRGPWRFNMLVFSLFGGVALALASVGLFGLVAYEVTRRSREIGLRMALGAARGHVVRLMVAHGAWPAAVGLAIGLVVSLLVTRLLAGLLFEVSATDPVTIAGVMALLLAVSVLASYLSARRAASVDPQVVLRDG